MTLRVEGSIRIDGSQAKAEVAAVGTELKEVATQSGRVSKEAGTASAKVRQMGSASKGAASSTAALAAQQRLAGKTAQQMGQQHQLAAGSLGNLTAQFNDIGVMLAAGQNPLQLALQQGTQITQVIGPMGAGAAVRSLGAAFMSLLSPINLITIGSIAAGAGLVQWLNSGSDAAVSFEESVSNVVDAIDRYRTSADLAGASTAELADRYSGTTSEVRELLAELANIDLRVAEQSAANLASRLRAEVGAFRTMMLGLVEAGELISMQDLFDLRFLSTDDLGKRLIGQVVGAFEAVETATNPAERVAAVQELRLAFIAAAEASGSISPDEEAFIAKISQMALSLAELQGQARATQRSLTENNGRSPSLTDADEHLRLLVEQEAAQRKANEAARATLADLLEQNAIQQAMVTHGQDSVEVARLRGDAERRSLEELLASSDASEDLKDAIRAAFEEGLKLSQLDIGSGIRGAVADAIALSKELGVSLETAARIATQSTFGRQLDQANPDFFDPRNDSGRAGQVPSEILPTLPKPPKPKSARGGASDDIRDFERQRAALERLIATEEQRIQILREQDPVNRELLRQSEAMAGATDAERQKVEALIRSRLELEEAQAAAAEAAELFAQTSFEALDGVLFRGESASDAIKNLGRSLASAAGQAALLGTGPLAGIFGISGGGLLGTIFGAATGTAVAPAARAVPGSTGRAARSAQETDAASAAPVLPVQRRAARPAVASVLELASRPEAGRAPQRRVRARSAVASILEVGTAADTAPDRALLDRRVQGDRAIDPASETRSGMAGKADLARAAMSAGAAFGESARRGQNQAPLVTGPGRAPSGTNLSGVLEVSLEAGLKARWKSEANQDAVKIVEGAVSRYDTDVLPRSIARVRADPRRTG